MASRQPVTHNMLRDNQMRMSRQARSSSLAISILLCACSGALAADDAARLGKDLTPSGAEVAGTKDGGIPAWSGTEAPLPGWSRGKNRGDFWKHKNEKPLFSIDASNVAKYEDKLTAGQIALVKSVKGYRMDVYPTHRTCSAPDFVLENTPKVHHMIVCTLCSCYPRTILGLPPLWYKSRAYRTRTVREPRAVLAEFGTELPDSVEVRVVDSTADCRYLVLPMRPEGTDGWSTDELARLATRDSMIGTAQALNPEGARG